MTGAGKSTYISLCTDERQPVVGHSLASCTSRVTAHTLRHKGRRVHLIDTPGFDDSERSDGETLQELAYWLAAAYTRDIQISGIVYLHRITDTRLQGSASRALEAFKKMVGEPNYCAVVLATTRWDELTVDQLPSAERRHRELRDTFWADIEDHGGRIQALSAGANDAMKIVDHIVHKDRRLTLAFQTELMETKLPLCMTGAGLVLYEPISKEYEGLEEQMTDVEDTLSSIITSDNESRISELRQYRDQISKEMVPLEGNIAGMKANIDVINRKWEVAIHRDADRLEVALESNARLLTEKEGTLTEVQKLVRFDLPPQPLMDEVQHLRRRKQEIMIARRDRFTSKHTTAMSIIGTGVR